MTDQPARQPRVCPTQADARDHVLRVRAGVGGEEPEGGGMRRPDNWPNDWAWPLPPRVIEHGDLHVGGQATWSRDTDQHRGRRWTITGFITNGEVAVQHSKAGTDAQGRPCTRPDDVPDSASISFHFIDHALGGLHRASHQIAALDELTPVIAPEPVGVAASEDVALW